MKKTSRRVFLKSNVAAAAVLAAPVLFAQSSKRRIKAGFLGGAHSHGLAKWKLLSASPEFELVGIAEDSEEVRSNYEKCGAKMFSQAELLRASELVIVESAVRDHAQHAKLALTAGRHVQVEKPPSVTMKEMAELVELAGRNKRVFQVGYMWRYHPGFAGIFEAARKGWLGDIYLARGTMNTSLAANRRTEWAEFKGGAMFELGCHLIDPIVRLLGRPAAVRPTLRRHAAVEDDLKDNNAVVFEFQRALGIVTNSVLQPNAFAHRHGNPETD